MIQRENQNTQNLFGTNAIVLADSGYQGLSSRLPGALTPFKRTRGRELNDDQLEFNHNISVKRIIVENWFGRHKVLWAKMSQKYRNNKGAGFRSEYGMNWTFCAALTNYQIIFFFFFFMNIFKLSKNQDIW